MSYYTLHPDILKLVSNGNNMHVFIDILTKFCSNEHSHKIVFDKGGILQSIYSEEMKYDIIREWFSYLINNPGKIIFVNVSDNNIEINDLIVCLTENNRSKKAIVSDYSNITSIEAKSTKIKVMDVEEAIEDLKIDRVSVASGATVAFNGGQIANGFGIVQTN